MAVASFISRAWRLYRREGAGLFLRATLRKIYDRHRSVWFDRPLDENLEVIKPRFDGRLDFDHPDLVIAWIEELDIPGTNDPVEIASMKERGQLFVGIMNGEKIIGYIKIGWDLVYVLDYRFDIQMPEGEYFIIDIFVEPESRGLGAGLFLVSASTIEMHKRGFRSSVMHVRTDKTPMLRSCARTGYREIGRVDFITLFGKKILRPHPAELLAGRSNRSD